jgi:hypothetical protein
MSYFNEYQQDYMRELASLPAEAKCECGWYYRGKCPHQRCKDAEATRVDTGASDGNVPRVRSAGLR